MSTTQNERLRGLLEPLVGGRGLDLEEVTVTPAGKRRVLRVVVDADEGVQLDTCAELSRALSEVLDESDAMGGAPYVLEVTSPGAERPLTARRHFDRAVGRLIRVQPHDGAELVARIIEVDDAGVDLEVPGVKGRKPTRRRLGFDGIARARVEIEFNRKAAERTAEDASAAPGDDSRGGESQDGESQDDESQKEA